MKLSRMAVGLALVTVTMASAGPGPVAAPQARAGSMVGLKSGDEEIQAYLAVPDSSAAGAPAVVVVQEWWGLNDWVKSVADRLAAQGYVAIAPDLYRGQVATDMELAHELSRGLPQERALRDIRAAGAYLRARTDLAPRRTAVVGFCMGGGLALRAALDRAPFAATVICYGSPESDPARLRTLAGPLLGIFGGADRGIGADQTGALEQGLEQAHHPGEVLVFPGAGHAFLNDTRESYDKEQAPKAWQAIDAFLARNLKGRD